MTKNVSRHFHTYTRDRKISPVENRYSWDFRGSPAVGLSASTAEAWVQFLVGEPRSCMSHTAPKKKKKKPETIGLKCLPQSKYMDCSSRSATKIRYFSGEYLATSGSISNYKDELLLAFFVDSAKGVSWKWWHKGNQGVKKMGMLWQHSYQSTSHGLFQREQYVTSPPARAPRRCMKVKSVFRKNKDTGTQCPIQQGIKHFSVLGFRTQTKLH